MKILKNSNGQIVTYNNDPIIAEHTGITPLAYTVTFMVDGAVKYIISVDAGCSINEPPAFSDVTRAWCGWWTNETMIGGTKITFPYTPTADITIYGILNTLAGQTWRISKTCARGYGIFNINYSCESVGSHVVSETLNYLLLGYPYFESGSSIYIDTYPDWIAIGADIPFSRGPKTADQVNSGSYLVGKYVGNYQLATATINMTFIDGTDVNNARLMSWMITNCTRIS